MQLSPLAAAATVSPAQLLASHWLDGSAGLDISGLAFCSGELLAVSDKNSAIVYAVRRTEGSAGLVPWLRFDALQVPDQPADGLKAKILNTLQAGAAADFEGISCSDDALFLVSERHHRIVRVPLENPEDAVWLPWQWSAAARKRGYMQQFNGASEGLLKVGGDYWVALERDRRGLVYLAEGAAPQLLDLPPVTALDFRGRSEDLTGLAYYDGAMFTLERNAFAVCKRSIESLQAEWCIEYRSIEEAPQYVYSETRYGKAEGLAVDASGIYVVLDNNNVGRAAAPDDRRALLLQLAFPEGNSGSEKSLP
ncbi:esterase-like activity of phytase family protein [Microbulbifer marinus]|uniref:Phytase-like domain-containing protein n=1 Tax=Microbulbifer marinus TaxID=658218 RepID=A0A1H3WP88_9GAMM|nr:esterase-like activity of phytase family protein [Microbulbifer marinus]SDZ88008.1 hypothetical protein SAMN05216562_0961 [Microbulbifer marinus]